MSNLTKYPKMKIINNHKNNIPVLYSFRRCPFAIRARAAIFLSGIKVEIREVLLSNKPREMIELSPKSTVPVLKLENKVIDQSFDIMLWALSNKDKNNLLAPYIENKELVVNIINKFDTEFKYDLDRYKYSSRFLNEKNYLGKEKYKYKAEQQLNYLQSLFFKDTLYLNGNFISILDLALFPLIRQFRLADSNYFDNNKKLVKIKKWLETITSSTLFNSVMHKYGVWKKDNNIQYFYNERYKS